ncbi:hypothetical protein H6F96_12565 [Microcoleus sp. FACHB-53]|nr:hypothetical protein [Microcoleus sp. FACHB-53]
MYRLPSSNCNPENYEVAGELRAQAEVFNGFAMLLDLPGFGAIAETDQRALNAHPEQALEINYPTGTSGFLGRTRSRTPGR